MQLLQHQFGNDVIGRSANVATSEEEKRDLFYGQLAIIAARWFVILGGVVLVLWTARDVSTIGLPIALMAVLMTLNFYLHARYLVRKPANQLLVYLSSCVDLAMITIIVAFWSQNAGKGVHSPFFVFYYPVLLAVGLVLPPRISLGYAVSVVAIYLAVVLIVTGTGDLDMQKDLAERLITMFAAAALGAYYYRIARQRRAPQQPSADLLAEVRALTTDGTPTAP